MAREDLHFRLRIPEELKQRIETHAELNHRSMTAEIISRLTDSLNDDARLRIKEEEIRVLREDLAFQKGMASSLRHGMQIFIEHLSRASTGEPVSLEKIMAEISASQPTKAVE
jgi:bacterioferritin (cytochrome b1)